MPVTYREVEDDVAQLLREVVKKHHGDLEEAGVTYLLQFAHASTTEDGEIKGCALKHHGYPALALVSVVKLKDRVAGLPDARILLDGDRWPELTEEEKTAVLDHELEHLLLARDQFGNVKFDDAGRPKMTLRPHDAELGVFYSVVERHGVNAIEAQGYRAMHNKMTQMKFPWG